MKNYYIVLLCFLFGQTQVFSQGPASRTEARIDLVQSQYNLTGEGVLAIVLDRGVDYTHPDFIDSEGNTRIAYIYDLYDDSGANDPDNPYGIGTIYDENEINNSLQQGGQPLVNDIFGHGTATTGILAGNGSGADDNSLYKGVAPNAKIISIIVTRDYVPPFGSNPGQQGQYNPAVLPVAFEFAQDMIENLGMPSVTLLNIGSIGQPTDASLEFCEIVDDYVQNGHTFVCGVGDDGGQDNHAIEQLALNATTTFEVQKGSDGFLRFTGWYDETARCQLTIERPDGTVEGPFDPPQDANGIENVFLDQLNIYHRGANVEFENSSSDLRQLIIDMTGASGIYKIRFQTTALGTDDVIRGMLNPSRYYNDNKFVNATSLGGNINGFSSCFSTLSPGDYVANNTYVDVNGITRTRTGEGAPGELWVGSSIGPTMDGRYGIDLSAPGELAVGAYSMDSYYGNFPFNVMENSNGYYGIQNAVSGAAPILSGVVALMLEVNPELTPEEIKTILQETAREDSFTGATPNNSWGYGKLDALEAINVVYEMVSADDPREASLDIEVKPNPFNNEISIQFAESFLEELEISVYTLTGRKVYQRTISAKAMLNLQELENGIYFLQARSGNRVGNHKIVKF